MAKKLHMIFKLDEAAGKNKFLTVILSNPKNDLTAATVQTAMNACVTKKVFKTEGGFDIVGAWDAYIRDDAYMINDGVIV